MCNFLFFKEKVQLVELKDLEINSLKTIQDQGGPGLPSGQWASHPSRHLTEHGQQGHLSKVTLSLECSFQVSFNPCF